MADNTELNPGSGGRRLRSLEDHNGVHWPTATVAYATSLVGGDNSLQVVGPDHGLPVEIVGGGLDITFPDGLSVEQAGEWVVTLDPAAAVTISGPVAVGIDGSAVYDGSAALAPQHAKIDAAEPGDNTVVAAEPGKRIRVLRWGLTADGDVTIKWRSATDDISGPRPLTKYASAGGAYCPVGIFETAPGEPLNLSLSTGAVVGGELTYVLAPSD